MKLACFLFAALAACLTPALPAADSIPYVLKRTVPPPTRPVQTLTKLGSSVALENFAIYFYVFAGAPYEDADEVADAGLVKVFLRDTGETSFLIQDPTPHAGDLFGYALACDSPVLAVGAPGDDTGATDTGIVYMYTVTGTPVGSSTVLYTFHNPSPDAGDHFGAAVGVRQTSAFAARVVVGAPQDDTGATDAGRVYVFDSTSGTPDTPIATLGNPSPATGDAFGTSVGMNGNRVVVGAPFADAGGTDSGVAYVFDLTSGTPTVPVAMLSNPSPAAHDHFGASVAIDGNRVVVSAPGDDTGANDAGAVYVYNLTSGTPTVPVQTLLNPAPAAGDGFGQAIALSGARVVAGKAADDTGAADAGSAYVYDLAGATPTVPVTTLPNPAPNDGDGFGSAVAILGTAVAVGTPNDDTIAEDAGGVYVYDVSTATPSVPTVTVNDPAQSVFDSFGLGVAISGHLMVVGATGEDTRANDAGSAYIFDLASATPAVPLYTFRNPNPSTNADFGESVAISGMRVIVGSPGGDAGAGDTAGSAYVYDLTSPTPTVPALVLPNPQPDAGDGFGSAVAISGTKVAVAASDGDFGDVNAGSVHVYDLAGASPTVPVLNLANPAHFGGSNIFGSALAIDGTRVVVADFADATAGNVTGRVFVYDLAGAEPATPLILSDPTPVSAGDSFGDSVAISGSRLVVGASGKDVGASNSGRAYVYDLAGAAPATPVLTLNNPAPATTDYFGLRVAISGTRLLVAAPFDDTGANNTGSVYVYELTSATPTVPVATIHNPTPAANEHFGEYLAIDGETVVVGGPDDTAIGGADGVTYVFVPGRAFAQTVVAVAAAKDKGSAVSGEPAGTTFTAVGGPAAEGSDGLVTAFQATLHKPDGKTVKGIFADGTGVIARVTQTAPGAGTATFKSFGDPLVSEHGVAFSAKLSDGRAGIWTTAFGHGLEAVLLSGDEAPGLTDSKIATLMSFSLRGEEIVALLKLKVGAGGITAATDTVLVQYDTLSETRLLQEGDLVTADGANSAIKKLSVFTPAKLAPGQDRSHAEGVVALNVTLADGRLVALAVDSTGARDVIAANRTADGTKLYTTLGLPCAGSADAIVLKGLPSGAPKDSDEQTLVDIALQEVQAAPDDLAEGFAAPGGGGALFGTMSDPLVNDTGGHAFIAKLTGPKTLKLTAKNNTGLYWDDEGGLKLTARLGDFAPDQDGQPTTAQFSAIKLFGLPDGDQAGPVFTAKLTGAKGAGVTGKNNFGLYAVDSGGQLREVLRTNQTLAFGNATKTVKSFTALTGGVPIGGRRAFTTAGVFTARVTFTDKSTGIVRLEIP